MRPNENIAVASPYAPQPAHVRDDSPVIEALLVIVEAFKPA